MTEGKRGKIVNADLQDLEKVRKKKKLSTGGKGGA